jgi:hypothetical protein
LFQSQELYFLKMASNVIRKLEEVVVNTIAA